jgi:phage baseplate assembly protein W
MINVKYYPEDETQDTGTLGIKLPMNGGRARSNSGLFNMSKTTEQQAVSNYINLLLTKRGERYMQPNFGIGIQYRLFEQNTEALRMEIQEEILQQSAIWLPYIINDSVDVRVAHQIPSLGADIEHGIQVVITFRVMQSGANRNLVIFGDGGSTSIEVF